MISRLLILIALLSASMTNGAPIVAGAPDFFPFGESKAGKTDMKGIFYESLDAILYEQTAPYEVVIRPFPRLTRDVASGLVDFSFGFQAQSTSPLLQIGCHYNILVTRKSVVIKTEEDIDGLRIGFVANGIYQRLYGNKFNTRNELVADDESMFKMLLAGRVDGFFISNVVLESYLKFGIPQAKLPENWKTEIGEPFYLSSSPTFLQISHNSTVPFNEVSQITRIAEKLKVSDVFSDIYKKYGVKGGGICLAGQ